jgi:beta-galactosidase
MNLKTARLLVILPALLGLIGCASTSPKSQLAVPDEGWHLWTDTQAQWKDDALYLPEDVDLTKLPTNAPTGGWDALSDDAGMTVTLPSTVEQHMWGKFGFRPYKDDQYIYASTDPDVKNGAYEGVSWWWRDVNLPGSFANKVVLLHIRGARQRAEVYVNQKLVGYNLIAETSFDCDISTAIKAGERNRIAVRITNPGGRYDWLDTQTIKWGNYVFQRSHGFGGLDRAISISAHDPVYLRETWVLNSPQVRTVNAHATLRNETDRPESGTVEFDVVDPKTGQRAATQMVNATVAAHSDQEVTSAVICENAELWTTDTPRLYVMRTLWKGGDSAGGTTIDADEKRFGFRWFEPRGVGKQAGLFLNDSRIRLYTAISWGFWGLNGLWPTPELAAKEVADAKRLGLNCLNFHRNIGKEEVLALQDEKGLIRYMEAGGGATTMGPTVQRSETPTTQASTTAPTILDTSGSGGDAETFGEKYEQTKILRMIQQFRSHPSLVIYVIQNEIDPDLTNPRVFNLIRKMHALDPSRVIAAKSGIDPNHQAWMAPYDDTVYYDDGSGYSGWHDQHTVGGPGVWQDNLYQGPDKFTHRIDSQKEIVDWGEMLGSATPDHHSLEISQIMAHGGESYDLKDHQEVDAAYNQFLDRWQFRSAFPTTEKLYTDIGNKCYQFWARVIETARLAEGNDILSISGWESTAIENHSGLVDNLRNFKGDPELIQKKLALLLPVVKPRGTIFQPGDQPILDLYLLNETNRPAVGRLHLKLVDPMGVKTALAAFDSPTFVANQFVYPIKLAMTMPALKVEGVYKLQFSLDGATPAENDETIRVINPNRSDLPTANIGLIGDLTRKGANLAGIRAVTTQPYQADGKYDLLVVSPPSMGHLVHHSKPTTMPIGDPRLYSYSLTGNASQFHFNFTDLPKGPAEVSLYFSDSDSRRIGRRVFDVQINDKVVLSDFDIFKESGEQDHPIVKTFSVDVPHGAIDVFASKTNEQPALFNAIQIKAGGKTIAVVFGGDSFTDSSGQLWQPYTWPNPMTDEQIERVRQGTPLLVMTSDMDSADRLAKQLSDAGAFEYAGAVGVARAPWMGSWIITRHHAVFDGLPSDEVMKGDYQIGVANCYGLLVDGPAVEVVAAYGRDHDRHIGASLFTTKLGKGNVVFNTLLGMQPLMQERLLENQLRVLLPGR